MSKIVRRDLDCVVDCIWCSFPSCTGRCDAPSLAIPDAVTNGTTLYSIPSNGPTTYSKRLRCSTNSTQPPRTKKTKSTRFTLSRCVLSRSAPSSGRPPGGDPDGAPPSALSSVNAQVGKICSYDLGALKALFHHARAVRGKKPFSARDRSGADDNSNSPVSSADGWERETPRAPIKGVPDRGSSPSNNGGGDDLAGGGSTGKVVRDIGAKRSGSTGDHEGETVTDSKGPLAGGLTPDQSLRVFDEIGRRLSYLEMEISPRNICERGSEEREQSSDRAPRSDRATPKKQSTPAPVPVGGGGGFARLVVIKELQPVPEHAPEDVRHLLERTLDHHQVIRRDTPRKFCITTVTLWPIALPAGAWRGIAFSSFRCRLGPLCGHNRSMVYLQKNND